MTRVVRAAMTQTRNAYPHMPDHVAELDGLTDQLEAIRAANVQHHVDLMRAAKARGVQVICFGELFTGPYFAHETRPVWLDLAEPALDGPTVRTLAPVARELGMVVIAPLYEYDARVDTRFNTAVFIDADGTVLGSYRKTHVPQGQNEKGPFSEGFYFERSDGGMVNDHPANISKVKHFPVFETAVGRLGCCICYDRHFEGVVSTLAGQGAEIIFSPAVTFGRQSNRCWSLEFAVESMRWNVFIGGSNRIGAERPWNVDFFGQTHFVGPTGQLRDPSDHPELIIADLDLDRLNDGDGSGWNLPRDRRPDIYG
jgi:beta-ureidopropionase